MEHLRSAAVSINIDDPILRYSITLSRISQAFQLLFDNFYLFSRLGLIRLEQGQMQSLATKFWLYADLLNLIRAGYEIQREMKDQQKRQKSNLKNYNHSFYGTCKSVVKRRPDLFIDLAKNLTDVWVPLNSLNITNHSPGVVGLCGTVSSVLSAMTIWDRSLKLGSL